MKKRTTFNLKYIFASLAIVISVTSFQPVNAQSYEDEVIESYEDEVIESYEDEVIESYEDEVSESYEDEVSESYEDEVSESYEDEVVESHQDEIPKIGWKSNLSSMELDRADNIGKTYDFHCQPAPDKFNHALWGTNVYTVNSGICSAAVHSGMISSAGGTVSLELREGKEFYTGSDKNDVESEDRSGTDLSFAFVGEPVANEPDVEANSDRPNPSGIGKVMVNTVQKGIKRSIQEAIIDLFD